ncbi:MAG TPA: ATP-binding protein [Stackebrandtia sp.]|jgi:signal transduction histidine kinase|uniref:sensor histidine kinase n=1 Tax=Stackebrandtia sp. TaxID=2023065 RepID=UPI002D5E1EAF|nr:ATP-binding protein [Stackebrandtia sp.]HZE41284.1 ATP-binding protein [Stackebrandtia sp.]
MSEFSQRPNETVGLEGKRLNELLGEVQERINEMMRTRDRLRELLDAAMRLVNTTDGDDHGLSELAYIGVDGQLRESIAASRFNADDEAVLQALAAAAGIAVETARMYEVGLAKQRWLAAASDIRDALLAGATSDGTLQLAAHHVADVLEAATVVILLPSEDPRLLTARTACGAHSDELIGHTMPSHVLNDSRGSATGSLVLDVGETLPALLGAAAEEYGSALAVPFPSPAAQDGALIALRANDTAGFATEAIAPLASFAEQAALALQAAEGQRAQRMLDVLADRDRIAADLHDHVIQRLYGCGINLQGLVKRISDPLAKQRVNSVIEQLDHTIRDIRTSIFDLHEPAGGSRGGLRRRLLDIAAEAADNADVTPTVRLSGALDTLVPGDIAEQAAAVVREGVSNAVRHAASKHITVTAEATDTLTIEVVDDGVGIAPAVPHSGLTSLRHRAESHGGTFSITPTSMGGTRLVWRVPLS